MPRKSKPSGRYPKLLDKQWLHKRYVLDRADANKIAAEIGCCSATALRALRDAGITVRGKHEAMRIARGNAFPIMFDQAEAVRLYGLGIGCSEIARQIGGGCAPGTIARALRDNGVKIRSKSEASTLRRNSKARRWPAANEVRHLTGTCAFCRTTDFLEVHHRDGDPSNNAPDNLCHVCWEHHVMLEHFIRHALRGSRMAAATT